MRCRIHFQWDADAAVWVATSADVPGLVLEGGSLDALIERVKWAVPELVSLNSAASKDIRMSFETFREDVVPVYG